MFPSPLTRVGPVSTGGSFGDVVVGIVCYIEGGPAVVPKVGRDPAGYAAAFLIIINR
jgi:hypothetical protein